jgi:cytochrome b
MKPQVLPKSVPVWDAPTRLFHWSLVILIVLAIVTNKMGSQTFYLHKINGYLILSLVLYRIIWGFVGGPSARFFNFVRPFEAPVYVFDLLRGKSRHFLGHNPAGGLMVLALLAIVGAQALFGLFTLDDIPATIEGPFASKVAESSAEWASVWHRRGIKILMALAGLHLLANLFYTFVKKDNLIKAMVTGSKPESDYEDMPASPPASTAKAAAVFLLSVAIVFGSVYMFGSAPFR